MNAVFNTKMLAVKKAAYKEAEKAYERSNGKHRAETRHAMVAAKHEYEELRKEIGL